MTTQTRQPKIAVVLPDFKPWGITPFFNGVREHAISKKWLLTACPVNPQGQEGFPNNWSRLKSWRVDGVILLTNQPEVLKMFQKLRQPLVYIGESLEGGAHTPRLSVNHAEVARLAAEHLIGLGLKNLAYHGVRDRVYSNERMRHFMMIAKKAQLKATSFCLPNMTRDALWDERYEPVKRWLKSLPLPVGIMTVSDYRALILLSACKELGLRVPDDVAVIGVDNDLMICEFSVPPLTSVCLNPHRMGLEAARMLDRLMQGESPQKQTILIEPSQVVPRASTNILHVTDAFVKRAIEFMQQHHAESFNIDAVAQFVGVSRRFLEKRFRQERNISPAEFLLSLRIQKARAMLASGQYKSAELIARSTGFATGKNLRAAFRRVFNAAPNSFRPSAPTQADGR
jgi:LacI family transcriptional regulator